MSWEKRGAWTTGWAPRQQAGSTLRLEWLRRRTWPEPRRTEVRWKVAGKEKWAKECLRLLLFNSFCCVGFSFMPQCHAWWLWCNYWTVWIWRTKNAFWPKFKLFFFLNPEFYFLFIHCLRYNMNEWVLFPFDLHFRLFKTYGWQPSKEGRSKMFYSAYHCSALCRSDSDSCEVPGGCRGLATHGWQVVVPCGTCSRWSGNDCGSLWLTEVCVLPTSCSKFHLSQWFST